MARAMALRMQVSTAQGAYGDYLDYYFKEWFIDENKEVDSFKC